LPQDNSYAARASMGSHLSEPITVVEEESGVIRHDYGVSWSAGAMQGWRSSMEDAHITLPEFRKGLGLFGVFDGHGGKEVALYCRNHLPEVLNRQLSGKGENKTAEALTNAYLQLDLALKGKAAQQELAHLKGRSPGKGTDVDFESMAAMMLMKRGKGVPAAKIVSDLAKLKKLHQVMSMENHLVPMGSAADHVGATAVCVVCSEEEIICANAGDARAVLCRGGRAMNLSRDHKPSEDSERRRIEAAGGIITAAQCAGRTVTRVNGLSLSRAIGDHAQKQRPGLRPEQQAVTAMPEICTAKRSPDDEFVILACDGIWDVKSSQQVVDFVRCRLQRGVKPPAIVEQLLHACLAESPVQGVGCDNMTVVLVILKPLSARKSSFSSWLPSPLTFFGGQAPAK